MYVDVYSPYKSRIKDEMIPATINWSALGSVDIETAETFVAELQRAIVKAKLLNTKEGLDK